MLKIEEILGIAKMNGAIISKDTNKPGVGYTDADGVFHEVKVRAIVKESEQTNE